MKQLKFTITILALALLVCSCQKNGWENPDSPLISQTPGDPARLISYVLNSDHASFLMKTKKSRTAVAPSIPSDAIDMVADQYEAWKAKTNTSYLIPAGSQWTAQIQLKNKTDYYVSGTLKLSSYGSGGTIYVMPGGKIEITGTLDNGTTIENFGEALFANSLAMNNGSSFKSFSQETIVLPGSNIQGTFETTGNVHAQSFLASGQKNTIHIGGNLTVEQAFNMTNSIETLIEGSVSAKSIEMSSNAVATFNSCVAIAGKVDITNSAKMNINSYLTAGSIDLSSTGTIYIKGNALIATEGAIQFSNPNSVITNIDPSLYAVVSCGEVIIHHDQINRLGGGPIDLHASKYTNNTGKDLRWSANVIFGGKTHIPATSCRPEFGKQEPVTKEYILSHVVELISPDLNRISATAIDFKNNEAFVSWHEYGEPYQGYIDIFSIGEMKLKATLHTETLDFNHICVNDGNVYVAGGSKTGAFYADVAYSEGAQSVDIKMEKTNGASGNCVLKENNNIWVISGAQGGVTLFPAAKYTDLAQAKYIVKQGNNMAVLAGITDTQVHEYTLEGEPTKSYSVGTIAPENGKNTMATDGETLYIALGNQGVKAFKNGIETAAFAEADASLKPAANCVDVDDRFVYVANGNAGLYILNKADLTLVKSYTLGGASANFVKKGSDGLIYVAYGLKGVHVFKLSEI